MFSSSKPHTAVTVYIDRLTGPGIEENDLSGIVDLIEVIQLQQTGPTEAARAIRKKLKYGSSHSQLRALTILDGLIQNAGGRFQRTVADEPLLERLRLLPRDDMVDSEVRAKCNLLFRQWAHAYKTTPGLSGIAALHKQLPSKRRPQASQSKVLQETEAQAAENPFGEEEEDPPPASTAHEARRSSIAAPSSSTTQSSSSKYQTASATALPKLTQTPSYTTHKKDKKTKRKTFNLEREKSNILQTIASASMASTNLLNALKLINREHKQVSEDPEAMNRFETCKVLRSQILRYIHLIENDQWIGSLLSANDELVNALMTFEIMDKSIEDDSDSDTESVDIQPQTTHSRKTSKVNEAFAGLAIEQQHQSPEKPPRPRGDSLQHTPKGAPPPIPRTKPKPKPVEMQPAEHGNADRDEDDPFGDQNAIRT